MTNIKEREDTELKKRLGKDFHKFDKGLLTWKEIPLAGVTFHGAVSKNRTSAWSPTHPKFFIDKCTQCNLCVIQCPEDAFIKEKVDGELKITGIDYYFCKGCTICQKVCPLKNKPVEERPLRSDDE